MWTSVRQVHNGLSVPALGYRPNLLQPQSDVFLAAWFARNRLRLTGRSGACDSGRCRIP